MLWTIQGSSMVVYIYIEYCWGQPWNHLWLSTYISSNALDNLVPVMLWTILGSSMVFYTYIQYCRRQSRGHLSLSTYIYRNAVDNPTVNYGCLYMYPVMPSTILWSTMVVYIYIQKFWGQSLAHLWLSYIHSNAVDNPGVIYGCLIYIQ